MAYTTIDDPSAHFQVHLYSGTSSTNAQTFGGNSDLQPDLVWLKGRSGTSSHVVVDTSRSGKELNPDNTDADENDAGFDTFNSDGFTVSGVDNHYNNNSYTYVAWCWKANGGTTSSNTNGTITTTVQANATAGFSIATYTGVGAARTIGHGLASAPKFMLIKNRTAAANWNTSCWFLTGDNDKKLILNITDAESSTSNFQDTDPSSTVVSIGGGNEVGGQWENVGNYNYIAYFWIPIQGYSKFGKYTGNGSTDGPFIYTGFKPAFTITKKSSDAGEWFGFDNKRNTYNPTDTRLELNDSAAEGTSSTRLIDVLANGCKIK